MFGNIRPAAGFGIRFSAYSLNMSGIFSIFAVGWFLPSAFWLDGFGEYLVLARVP